MKSVFDYKAFPADSLGGSLRSSKFHVWRKDWTGLNKVAVDSLDIHQ